MDIHQTRRRRVLQTGGGFGLMAALSAAGFVVPKAALAEWNKAAFEGKTVADAMKALGATSPAASGEVQIIASDIAENGAVVPIQVVSRLAGTQQIAVFVEKNPNVLAAVFDVGPDLAPDFTTRVKMAESSNIVVLVKSAGGFATATKEIKVTLGGCGG
ncbi:MAG: thiosulfate oxidation carrier protein SoxY [Rhodospirillales bacterium]|nr:thiosulfate oxidation carrier protein SoxY [Rhodospirillales bacterium]